jgi:hypothetical protein
MLLPARSFPGLVQDRGKNLVIGAAAPKPGQIIWIE